MLLLVVSFLGCLQTSCGQVVQTCPGLGDFYQNGTFDGFVPPTCPGDPGLDLVFTMYSTSNLLGRFFDRDTIPDNFIPTAKTLFIVHGWNSDGGSSWLGDMKDTLLDNETPANAVIVSWGGPEGSNAGYLVASSTTRTVGAELAEVMINLVTAGGGDTSLFHCVGHSLGSHVCGHFGRWAGNKGYRPARVTGMDPAGPGFATNEDRLVGIWVDCADFVDVIHTDRSLGSAPEPGAAQIVLGHQDFYPNDGNNQPGCGGSDSCSHSRVHALFTSSIANNCFQATGVCSASNDIPGSCVPCEPNCAVMGYPGSDIYPNGIYRLDTTGLGSYCPLK